MGQSITRAAVGRPLLDTTKLALIYPRQSTANQLENNVYSLENQLRLRERALADGFPEDQVVVIDDDLGKSARTISGRAGMSRALKLIASRQVGALYAEDQTRLSRDIDTVDHMEIAKQCRQARVPMFYGGSWRDMNDGGTRLAFKIEAVIGSEMWAGHLEKMHANQRLKAERGQAASSIVKWGYRVNRDVPRRHPDRDKLMIHAAEAAIIRTLVSKLEAAGSVRELYRRTYPVYWPDGKLLTYRTLSAILRNPIYRGHYVWGDVYIEGAHEAIIGPAEAAMIDNLAETNRAVKRGPTNNSGGILLGRLWCPTCARKIYHSRSNQKPDYRCQVKEPGQQPDNHFSLQSPRLDQLVVEDLWLRLSENLVDGIISRLEERRMERDADVDMEGAARRTIERRVEGLSRSLADPEINDATRKVLIAQLNQVTTELEALNRPQVFRTRIDTDLAIFEEIRRDKDFLLTLPNLWPDEPLDWKRRWIGRFIERVDVLQVRRGCFEIAVHYQDGRTANLDLRTKPEVTEEELELVRALWFHEDRPVWGWTAWMGEQLAKAGHPRTRAGVLRIVNLAIGRRKRS